MKRILLVFLLLVPLGAFGQDTPTPTETPTPTPTATPTITPIISAQPLAVLDVATTESCWQYTGSHNQLEIRNIGSSSVTLRLGQGVVELTPTTPTPADGEYILPAGDTFLMPRGRKMVCYASEAVTALSVSVTASP